MWAIVFKPTAKFAGGEWYQGDFKCHIAHLPRFQYSFFFKRFYLFYFYTEGKGGRERRKETSIGCLLLRPWPGIKPTTLACALTFRFAGQHPTNWTTWVRTQYHFLIKHFPVCCNHLISFQSSEKVCSDSFASFFITFMGGMGFWSSLFCHFTDLSGNSSDER